MDSNHLSMFAHAYRDNAACGIAYLNFSVNCIVEGVAKEGIEVGLRDEVQTATISNTGERDIFVLTTQTFFGKNNVEHVIIGVDRRVVNINLMSELTECFLANGVVILAKSSDLVLDVVATGIDGFNAVFGKAVLAVRLVKHLVAYGSVDLELAVKKEFILDVKHQ